jgi:hypothetical protein
MSSTPPTSTRSTYPDEAEKVPDGLGETLRDLASHLRQANYLPGGLL